MIPQPPPGQGPIDPRGAFAPPSPLPPPQPAAYPPMHPLHTHPILPPGRMPPMSPTSPRPYPPMGMPPVGYPPGMGMMMPPPPPRRGGGFGRALFTTVGVLLVLFSALLNLILLAGSLGDGSSVLQHTIQSG